MTCGASSDVIAALRDERARIEKRFAKNFWKFFFVTRARSRCALLLRVLHRGEALSRDPFASRTVVENFHRDPSLILRARERGEDWDEIGRAHSRAKQVRIVGVK